MLAVFARVTLPVAFAVVASVAFVNMLGPMVFSVAGLDLEVSATIGKPGCSSLTIPPLGTVTARTHAVPVAVGVSLKNVEPKGFSESLRSIQSGGRKPDSLTRELAAALKARAPGLLARFVARQLLLAFAGGLLGAYLCRRRLRAVVGAAVVATALVGLALGSTALAFDTAGFARPEYRGVIEAAPWALGLINGNLAKLAGLGESVRAVGQNIFGMFSQADRLSAVSLDPGMVRLLHVSDIHNNAAALKFVLEVARVFKVDAVIDSGDITDFGTPIEAEMISGIEQLGVPYLVVGGNHDSPAVLAKLARTRNVRILSRGPITVKGIIIAGRDDPWMGGVGAAGGSEVLEAGRGELSDPSSATRSAVARLQARLGREVTGVPDVLVVHRLAQVQPLIAEGGPLEGLGLVLYGHDHTPRLSMEAGTVVCDSGTTGGAGVRGLAAGGPQGGVGFTLSMVHMLQRPVAVDTIRLEPNASGFALQRSLVGERQAGREGGQDGDADVRRGPADNGAGIVGR